MTIKEEISLLNDLLGVIEDDNSRKYLHQTILKLEAKEKELEKALVIPEGWYLSTYGFIDDGRDKPFYIDLMRRGELVKGYGATEHEALINAIKQIK